MNQPMTGISMIQAVNNEDGAAVMELSEYTLETHRKGEFILYRG